MLNAYNSYQNNFDDIGTKIDENKSNFPYRPYEGRVVFEITEFKFLHGNVFFYDKSLFNAFNTRFTVSYMKGMLEKSL